MGAADVQLAESLLLHQPDVHLGSSGNYGPLSTMDISGFTPPFTATLQ